MVNKIRQNKSGVGGGGLVLLGALLLGILPGLACQRAHSGSSRKASNFSEDVRQLVQWPPRGRGGSSRFWKHWGDGRAEMSSYVTRVSRYGKLREAEQVLIYVTEPMSRKTWIKDDGARGSDRVNVLKLNRSLKFLTGIYPYSVLLSTFSPVGSWRQEAFAPVKVTMTVQEWCGHVFQGLWSGPERSMTRLMSYFASEGERTWSFPTPKGTLYEDALWIQLRELDGPFAKGKDWSGKLVPSLWHIRKNHIQTQAVDASIKRSEAKRDGKAVRRFVLRYGSAQRTYDIEKAWPHRVLHWSSSEGEEAKLKATQRLPYWGLNGPSGKAYRQQIGLSR